MTSLESWTDHFGAGFSGILAFVYRLAPELELAPGTLDAFPFRDALYLVRGVEVERVSLPDANAQPQLGDRSPADRHVPRHGEAVFVVPARKASLRCQAVAASPSNASAAHFGA